jgi:hypothetical protein
MNLLLLLTSAALAADPAVYNPAHDSFLGPNGSIEAPEFDNKPAVEVHPEQWLQPGQQLLSWGVFEDQQSSVDGVVWLELDDGNGSPYLIVVSDREGDIGVPDVGTGSLLATVTTSDEMGGGILATWAIDEILHTWNELPDGPIIGSDEAFYSSEGGLIIVILTGCPGTGRPVDKVGGPTDNMDDLPEDPGPGPDDEPEECPAETEEEESPTE